METAVAELLKVMENGFGGAKPKTKTKGSRDKQHSSHNCSKEKHKHKKTYPNSHRYTDDKQNRIMENGFPASFDNFANDCNEIFETSRCTEDSLQNRMVSESILDLELPSFMPGSNLSDTDIFKDEDCKRKETDIHTDYIDDGIKRLNDSLDEVDDHLADSVYLNDKVKGRNRMRRQHQLNISPYKQTNSLGTRQESDKCEIIKRHQESLREKWKRSGLALRKFLSERLGFSSSSRKEKIGDESTKHEKEMTSRDCDNNKRHRNITSLNSTGGQGIVHNKKQKKGSKIKPENLRRKSSLNSDSASDKNSKSVISKLKLSFKSKRKKKAGDSFLGFSDDSYPSSPLSYQSSSNGSSFINNGISLSCDISYDQRMSQPDVNEILNDNEVIARLNLISDTVPSCDCQMCQTHNLNKAHSEKHTKMESKKKSKKLKSTKEKPKKVTKKTKAKKKQYIGVLDDAFSSSDDSLFKNGKLTLKRRHKDYARDRLSSNSQDTVTPENTPPQTLTTTGTTDVLSGLHYAIPFLPPRLRNRLQSYEDTSEKSENIAHGSKHTGHNESSKVKSSSKYKEKHSKTHNCFYDNFDRDLWLEDLSDPEQGWDKSEIVDDRNQVGRLSSPIGRSRTSGEIDNSSVFNRYRPVLNPFDDIDQDYNMIESVDKPFISQDDEVSAGANNFIETSKGDNSLYDFEDESLLEDLMDRMDRMCAEEEEVGTENNSFNPERVADANRSSEAADNSDVVRWSPLPVSESCDDADDEFECDCEHCSLLRQQNAPSDLNDLHDLDAEYETLRQRRLDEMQFGAESTMLLPEPYAEEDLFNINVLELNSLDFMLMAESTLRLDVMLENVIQQMLAVQPELLNDQVIPPASQSTIDSLETVTLTQEHIEQSPACPICLCPCELEEIMTSLVCSHLFHPLCIQAWLAKSGTCPVCRSPV